MDDDDRTAVKKGRHRSFNDDFVTKIEIIAGKHHISDWKIRLEYICNIHCTFIEVTTALIAPLNVLSDFMILMGTHHRVEYTVCS